jgi:hypothetical protein
MLGFQPRGNFGQRDIHLGRHQGQDEIRVWIELGAPELPLPARDHIPCPALEPRPGSRSRLADPVSLGSRFARRSRLDRPDHAHPQIPIISLRHVLLPLPGRHSKNQHSPILGSALGTLCSVKML